MGDGLIIRPGDVLIVGLGDVRLTASEGEAMRQELRTLIPELEIILMRSAVGMAVFRDDLRSTRVVGYRVRLTGATNDDEENWVIVHPADVEIIRTAE